MKREKLPETKQNNVAYLKETPVERGVSGILTILIGMGLIGCIVTTVIGIQKSGKMNFFVRMMNTIKSFGSDYYDIRTDVSGEYTIIIGTPLLKTTPDVRKVTAELCEDSTCGSFMPGSYGTAKVYIIPHDTNADLSVDLSFNVYGTVQTADGQYIRIDDLESDNYEQDKCRLADKLLDGHILLFTEMDNGYSGLMKNGRLLYNTAEHHDDLNANGEYEVTVYWIWAEYYEQLTSLDAEGAAIKNAAELEKVKEYISSCPDEFFFEGEEESRSEILSDRYDNADWLIHQMIDGYGFEIIANN